MLYFIDEYFCDKCYCLGDEKEEIMGMNVCLDT